MAVRIEKDGPVWTVIHSRPEARNAMDPESAKALYEAFLAFDADDSANVAVFWGEGGAFCAGWDLKHAAAVLSGAEALDPYDFPNDGEPPMAAMGPSRLELSKPVIAAVAGPGGCGRYGVGHLGRHPGHGGDRLHGGLLPPLGHSLDRRRHCALAAARR